MEALLVFLAIAAIQMLAAYSKQKKEAAKKAAQKYTPPPQATEPIPDPFREIREAMGMPSAEETEEIEEPEEIAWEETPVPEYKKEGFAPKNMPFQSITERKLKKEKEPAQLETQNIASLPMQVHINNLEQGILWAAILQEPRYKVKWKQR
jgi:hypothetical protein